MNSMFEEGADWYQAVTPWTRDEDLMSTITTSILKCVSSDELCLEVGAGSGGIARAANAHGRGRWLVTDLSYAMLAVEATRGLWRAQADAGNLPVANETFGLVACRSVLHYVGAERGLREWQRVLKPGGGVVLAQKVADNMREDLDWYQAVQLRRSLSSREWYFTEDLVRMAEAQGFTVSGTATHQGQYQVRLDKWSTRNGKITPLVADQLVRLARQGCDPDFAARTGFRLDGDQITMTLRWSVVTLHK